MTNIEPILSTLTELAEGHLATMSQVPWDNFARSIAERAPRPAGETFGCMVQGRYFDVGDSVSWLGGPNQNIHLRCYAITYFEQFEGASAEVERSLDIPKPDRTA